MLLRDYCPPSGSFEILNTGLILVTRSCCAAQVVLFMKIIHAPIQIRRLLNMKRQIATALLLSALLAPYATFGQQPPAASQPQTPAAPATPAKDPNDPVERIKEEGMNHSQVMETLSYLSDVIGPRLTASPNMKRSNEWTRDKLSSWGLQK